jgi:hypothetical protein
LQLVFKQAKKKNINTALVVSNSSSLPQQGESIDTILKKSPFYE